MEQLNHKELNSKIKKLKPGETIQIKTLGDMLREDQKRDR